MGEVRERMADIHTELSDRSWHDYVQPPTRYNPVSRMSEPPTAEDVAKHEAAVARATALRTELEALKGTQSWLTAEEKRKKQQSSEPDIHDQTRDNWVQHGGRDKTKRAQGIRAQQHRDAVAAALAAGKDVPPVVLADYPDLAPAAPAAVKPFAAGTGAVLSELPKAKTTGEKLSLLANIDGAVLDPIMAASGGSLDLGGFRNNELIRAVAGEARRVQSG